MFIHVVMFKLKDSSEDNVKKARDILMSMEGKIEELKYLEVGMDVLHTERSFDLILITKFHSKEDMDKYQVSEYHEGYVLKNLRPMLDGSKTVDYIG